MPLNNTQTPFAQACRKGRPETHPRQSLRYAFLNTTMHLQPTYAITTVTAQRRALFQKHPNRRLTPRNPLPLSRSGPLPATRLRHHARTHPHPANSRKRSNHRALRPMHQRRLLPRSPQRTHRNNLATKLPSTPRKRCRRLPQPTRLHSSKPQPSPSARPPIRPHKMAQPNRPHPQTLARMNRENAAQTLFATSLHIDRHNERRPGMSEA